MDFLLPADIAGVAVVAEDGLRKVFGVGGGEENLIADDDGGAVPAAGDRRLPENVFGCAPLERRLLIGIRDAIALRPAPPGPIVAVEGDGVLSDQVTGEQKKRETSDDSRHGKVNSWRERLRWDQQE